MSGQYKTLPPMYNVQLGISPINWINNDMLDLGDEYEIRTVLSDMQKLGFRGTEMSRKFPENPVELRNLLAEYKMVLTGAWKTVLFSTGVDFAADFASYQAHVQSLRQLGSDYVVVCDGGGSLHWDRQPRQVVAPYDDAAWRSLAEGLHRAGEYTRQQGMRLAYHPHVGTNVERPEAIERLLAMTDPDLVSIVFDTGHIYAGGGDPRYILRKYFGRIACVHLKDVRQNALDEMRETGALFIDAVRHGLFTTPGDGCLDFEAIVTQLRELGYQGWMVIEAEQNPQLAEPVAYATAAKTTLEKLMYTC
ncbi:myo-inosose-2 dehydratase [Alicyclobacillus fodiniaquatilis]|uniref:Myo-inosose-2 dehydratase n=1 Tax=Alicyclobacillus fodiniaquatilis TaxID=1661150 RepID=A0ABW4JKF2_9BACL